MENFDFLTQVNNNLTSVFNETTREGIFDDQILYHYTNIDSLISIIENRRLWCSSIELMNDKNEVDYSLNIIKKSLDEVELPQTIKEELISKYIIGKKSSALNTYIISLSTNPDSLILWNNYAKNDGYNIGLKLNFSNGKLSNSIYNILTDSQVAVISGRVLYSEKEQIKLMSCLLTSYYTIYSTIKKQGIDSVEANKEINNQWLFFEMYSSLLKSELHQYEDEYRIVLNTQNVSKGIKFRSRNGLILPYIELEFKDFSVFDRITIGPKINDQIAENGLDLFLSQTLGYKISIEKSLLKLRF